MPPGSESAPRRLWTDRRESDGAKRAPLLRVDNVLDSRAVSRGYARRSDVFGPAALAQMLSRDTGASWSQRGFTPRPHPSPAASQMTTAARGQTTDPAR